MKKLSCVKLSQFRSCIAHIQGGFFMKSFENHKVHISVKLNFRYFVKLLSPFISPADPQYMF